MMIKVNLFTITTVAAIGGLLFGFDMAVISGVLPLIVRQFTLTAFLEGWFVSSALIGCIAGVALSGYLSDDFGRRPLLMVSAVLFLISLSGCALCHSFAILIGFRILSGIAVGIASNIVPLYLSEIAPAAKRGRIVTYYQLAITVGILVAYLMNYIVVNYSLQHRIEQDPLFNLFFVKEIWRGMFAVGFIPSIIFFAGILLLPESPRWYFNKGRTVEGKAILSALGEQPGYSNAKDSTLSLKEENYRKLLSPAYRVPVIIGLLLPLFSQFCGINAIVYYGPVIMRNAGLSLHSSLVSEIIFGIANLLFTIIAIAIVDRGGRRNLYLTGSGLAFVSLLSTGYCFYTGTTSGGWLSLSVILFVASFACSIGPLKFVIAAEIFPGKIRAKAMSMSILTMWIADTLVGQLTPFLLKNLGNAGTFWFFSFFCLLAFITVYRLLPETKGKSLEEIESFWEAKNTSTVTIDKPDLTKI